MTIQCYQNFRSLLCHFYKNWLSLQCMGNGLISYTYIHIFIFITGNFLIVISYRKGNGNGYGFHRFILDENVNQFTFFFFDKCLFATCLGTQKVYCLCWQVFFNFRVFFSSRWIILLNPCCSNPLMKSLWVEESLWLNIKTINSTKNVA